MEDFREMNTLKKLIWEKLTRFKDWVDMEQGEKTQITQKISNSRCTIEHYRAFK